MPLKSHAGRDHGTKEIPDPKNPKEKIKVCAKFPTMTCDVHEQIGGKMRAFAPDDHQYVPFTLLVDPNTKKIIDTLEGAWSLSQFQKKIDVIDKAMPGPRVSQEIWDKYQKALGLIAEEKTKEALPALEALVKGKLPEKFREELQGKIDQCKESTK